MSEFAAIINNKRPLHQEQHRIRHMLQISPSNQDDVLVSVKKYALFGHGHEIAKHHPVSRMYEGQEYTIVMNGRLYGVKKLRHDLLSLGFDVADANEADLMLCAYLAWGTSFLMKCDGVFSCVIYNEHEIFAARDPLGVKPLFYVQKADGEWLFATAIKSFFQEGSILPILTKDKFIKMIALGPSLVPGETIYKNIKSLKPAHYMTIRSGRMQLNRCYTLQATVHGDDFETTKERVNHLVTNAIAKQCVTDASIGSMLSGGLDSSIVSLIGSCIIPNIPTFSLDYEGNHEHFQSSLYQSTEDGPYIQTMIARCQSRHQYHVISQQKLLDHVPDAMRAIDMPHMADIDASLLWFAAQIKQSVDVVLSGECTDEIFGGYPWFYRDDLIHLNTFPWLRALPDKINLLHDKWKRLDYYGVRKDVYESALNEVSYLPEDTEKDKIARKITYLCKDYFMQTLLSRQDAMAGRVGLEGRVPFADVELVNYVYNVPWHMKFHEGKEKGLLRAAFAHSLPEMIANRKKNPYPKTHHPRYTDLVVQALRSRLSKDSLLLYLFDENKLNELIDTKGSSFSLPWFGQLMSGPQLLAYLYQIDLWLSSYEVKIEF